MSAHDLSCELGGQIFRLAVEARGRDSMTTGACGGPRRLWDRGVILAIPEGVIAPWPGWRLRGLAWPPAAPSLLLPRTHARGVRDAPPNRSTRRVSQISGLRGTQGRPASRFPSAVQAASAGAGVGIVRPRTRRGRPFHAAEGTSYTESRAHSVETRAGESRNPRRTAPRPGPCSGRTCVGEWEPRG